jgi:hypothetical protein
MEVLSMYLLEVREVPSWKPVLQPYAKRYRFGSLSGPIHVDATVLQQLPADGERSDLVSQRYTGPIKNFITTDAIKSKGS